MADSQQGEPTGQVELGAFTLTHRIGQGGMAQVWGAAHPSGASAAIKVMTADRAQDPRWRSGFLREIRATAGLNHPNIVRLFDCGVVPASAAHLGLVPGSPWVAMERAAGDLLGHLPTHWGGLRRILFEILDALAHAHARGVIHRDLKPANVLVTDAGGAWRLQLTDFGIAHVGTEESALSASPTTSGGGTPEYMAPEQVTGRVAEQGPWTDLYALGCLAYTLASGRPPFAGESALNIAIQHVTHVADPLAPRFAVPAGLGGWVARLMSRSPRGRYDCAADAACALARLSEGFAAPPPVDAVGLALSDTVAAFHTMALDVDALTLDGRGATRTDDAVPPMPETWQTATPAPEILADAGLGLLGVRRPPMLGRVAHRDQLWAALRAANAGAPARMIALMGSRGLGTSTIARWVCERAAEVGAAEIFEAQHQRTDTADDGIGAMLRRHFNALALEPAGVRAHIERWVDGPWAADLATAALWSPDGDADAGAFESADVRHAIVGRYLAERATLRPVILFIDEGQWGGDTLAFALWLLRAAVPRVLIIMAFDQSSTALSGPASRAHWARLDAHPLVTQLPLEPLSHAVHCRLIASLLPLDAGLRAAIHTHTAGRPRFAHALMLYWAEEGWLRSGADGFVLHPGVDAWPANVGEVFVRRIERLAQADDSTMRAVELAAVLGLRVFSAQWVAVCRALKVPLPMGLVDRLLRAGLALPRPGGWAFSHDAAVGALRDQARAHGRLAQANLVCARVLEPLGEPVLRYLYRAGAYGALVPKMMGVVRGLMARSEYGSVLTLLQMSKEPFAALGIEPPDPRWIEARMIEARALRFAVGVQPALAVLAPLEPLLDQAPPPIAAQLAHARATIAGPEVDFEARQARYEDALTRYRALGEDAGAAECLHGLGLMAMLTGRMPQALAHMNAAVQRADAAASVGVLAWALQGCALVKRFMDDPSGEADAERALALFKRERSLSGMGAVHFSLGDFRLAVGDFAAAEAHLQRSLSVLDAIDSQMVVLPRIALVAVAAHQGDLDAAARRFADVALVSDDRIFNSAQILTRYHSLGLWLTAARAPADAEPYLTALEAHADAVVLDTVRANLRRARQVAAPSLWARLDALLGGLRSAG